MGLHSPTTRDEAPQKIFQHQRRTTLELEAFECWEPSLNNRPNLVVPRCNISDLLG